MKTKILSILSVLFFCATMSVNAQAVNYVFVKTVYADGTVSSHAPLNPNQQFVFERDRVYFGSKPAMSMGDGTDGYRLHSRRNGMSIYYYYRSGTAGLVQTYRTSQPYWDYSTAIIVSADRQTINMCYYDRTGNLTSTTVYKIPSAPRNSGIIY